MDGDIKIAIVQPKDYPVQIDKKIKYLVQELKRFHVNIHRKRGLSESSWYIEAQDHIRLKKYV